MKLVTTKISMNDLEAIFVPLAGYGDSFEGDSEGSGNFSSSYGDGWQYGFNEGNGGAFEFFETVRRTTLAWNSWR